MKRIVLALATTFTLAAFSPAPAGTAQAGARAAAPQADELSSARKAHKASPARRHHRAHGRAYRRGPPAYAATPRWRPADPSFGPYYSLRNAQRSGRCVEDLGYGRWRYCDWD
jgi:hypothetical protein